MILPMLLLPHLAQAIAPANAIIKNTATLKYTGNTTGITASVNVGVLLSPAAVTLSAPTDNTVAEGQPTKVSYTITSNANGPDTYNLTSTLTKANMTGTPVITFKKGTGIITTVTLGATAANVAASAGATSISVPADGTANSSLNGLVNGDEVNIAGALYLVNITDTATGSQTLTLQAGTLSTGVAASTTLTASVPIGTLIKEQQIITMNIDNVGTITVAGTAATDTVITTAKSATDNAKTAADTHITTVVAISFEKFVRNVTNANNVVGATTTTLNGSSFFATAGGVTSKSTDTLEYAIRVTTPTSAGIAAGATITDAVPTFTTYVANSTRLNAIVVPGDNATSPLIAGVLIDDNTTRAATALATGIVAAGKVVVLTFQVTVD